MLLEEITVVLVGLCDRLILWQVSRQLVAAHWLLALLVKMTKAVCHWLTGRSELRRLLEDCERDHTFIRTKGWGGVTSLIEDLFKYSRQLRPTWNSLRAGEPSTLPGILREAALIKGIVLISDGNGETGTGTETGGKNGKGKGKRQRANIPSTGASLGQYLGLILAKHALLGILEGARARPVTDATHLQRIWRGLLAPSSSEGMEATATVTDAICSSHLSPGSPPPVPDKRWQELGFQGADPRTDFRGTGSLGVQQLATFAEEHPRATIVWREAQQGPYWYSFAIVAINATAALHSLLVTGQLNGALYQRAFPMTFPSILIVPVTATTHTSVGSARKRKQRTNHQEGPTTEAVRAAVQHMQGTLDNWYGEILLEFHQRWVEARPANLFAFNSIFTDTMRSFIKGKRF